MCCALRRVSASSSEDQPTAAGVAAAGLISGAASPKTSAEGGNVAMPPTSLSQRDARLQGEGAELI